MGRACGLLQPVASGGADFYRLSRRGITDETAAVRAVYLGRFLSVVSGPGLHRATAGSALEPARAVLSSARRNCCGSDFGGRLMAALQTAERSRPGRL